MSCPDKHQMLSHYLDGELSGEARAELEAHLKGCEDCRNDLAVMRGIERRTDRAIKALQVEEKGFVEKVMRAISGRHRSIGGAGTNWVVFLSILAGTVLLVALAATLIVRAVLNPAPCPPLPVVAKLAVGSGAVEVEYPGGATENLEGGSELVAGCVVTAGPEGALVELGGAKVYIGPKSRVGLPVIETGASYLYDGRIFVRTGDEPGRAASPGASIELEARSSVYLGTEKHAIVIPEGRMTLTTKEGKTEHAAGVIDDARAFRPSWVPASQLPSVWPCEGGSHLASGWTPLEGPGAGAKAERLRSDMKAIPALALDRSGAPVVDVLYFAGPLKTPGLGMTRRPDATLAVSYAGEVRVVERGGAELKRLTGISPVGPPVLIDDDEPVIATGSVLKRGDKVAGPISTKLLTGPAADGEGYAYAVGGGGYLLGLGPEGECMRMKIDGLAPVRPTVTRAGDVFVATGWDIWKLARGAEKLPEQAHARVDAMPSCQMVADGKGRLYCVTKRGTLRIFSPGGAQLFEHDLVSPARGLAIGRGRTLYVLLEDGALWKITE